MIGIDARWSYTNSVWPYGSDYYEFLLHPTLEELEIRVDGSALGNYSYHFIGIKNNKWMNIDNTAQTDYTYFKTLTPGQWDKVALIVGGKGTVGGYNIDVFSPYELLIYFPAKEINGLPGYLVTTC